MTPESLFFLQPEAAVHKRYEALRSFYVEGMTAREVSAKFGYTVSTVYALARDFKRLLSSEQPSSKFFIRPQPGRKEKSLDGSTGKLIVELRKKYLSVSEIKAILDSLGEKVSEKYIYNMLVREGFTRLPRRSNLAKTETRATVQLEAAKSELLVFQPEELTTESSIGVLCLLPYIQELRIDRLIEESEYPETKTLPKLNALLSFVALKLSNVRRYTADDLWCMDRGLGLFAGLNVLPKAAWYTSYSHRVTRNTNLNFLKSLAQIWIEKGFLSDTANLDFTTIPYWGEEDSHLENNWSGTRRKALASMLAIFAHEPQSGIITYGGKYARRWLVEKTISEQIEFFHLNKISSSMVIKVDFDLTISILTHNLYRIFASDLEGYSHCTPQTLYQKFIHNSGYVKITDHQIIVQMKKKRHLPILLTSLERFQAGQIRWLGEKELVFQGASIS